MLRSAFLILYNTSNLLSVSQFKKKKKNLVVPLAMVFEEVMMITDKGAVKTEGTAVKNSDSLRCSDLRLGGWLSRFCVKHKPERSFQTQTESHLACSNREGR